MIEVEYILLNCDTRIFVTATGYKQGRYNEYFDLFEFQE